LNPNKKGTLSGNFNKVKKFNNKCWEWSIKNAQLKEQNGKAVTHQRNNKRENGAYSMQLIWIMTTDNFSIFNKYKEKNKLVSLTPA